MRKKILAFVFAAALLVAMAVPLFGGGGTALAQGAPTTSDILVNDQGNTDPTDDERELTVTHTTPRFTSTTVIDYTDIDGSGSLTARDTIDGVTVTITPS